MAELIVALDTSDLKSALILVDRLRYRVHWFKIGLELFSAFGPKAVEAIRARDCRIFLDLKYLDIPNTVQSATRVAAGLGVDMLTVHLSGGRRMVQAALEGARQGCPSSVDRPLVVGVTMLTSLNREDVSWMIKPGQPAVPTPGELAFLLAEHGRKWGVDGVVCSAQEAARIKSVCGPWVCVTPGIRIPAAPTSSTDPRATGDDQSRTLAPGEAVAAGADYLVVGRPVTTADNPVHAAENFLRAMAHQS